MIFAKRKYDEVTMKDKLSLTESEYSELLHTAVTHIHSVRSTLALQVNSAATATYWNLGMLLHERKIEDGYGSNVINRLWADLKVQFPDMGLPHAICGT